MTPVFFRQCFARRFWFPLLILLAGCTTGCGRLQTHGISGWQAQPGPSAFSPDGAWFAYALNERVFREVRWYTFDVVGGHDHYDVLKGEHECRVKVEWVSIADPGRVQTVDLGGREPYRKVIMLRFSPDSKRLAVLERDRVTTIDLESRRCRVAPFEDDTGKAVTWVSAGAQTYLTHRGLWLRSAEGEDHGDLVLPLKLVPRPIRASFPASREGFNMPDTYVSPRGRYLIAHANAHGAVGPTYVVDSYTNRVMELSLPYFISLHDHDDGFSWKPDETALVIAPFLYRAPPSPTTQPGPATSSNPSRTVVLVDLERWEHRDITDQISRMAGGKYFECPRWTEDGKFWTIGLNRGWLEVSPATWEFTAHEGTGGSSLRDGKVLRPLYEKKCRYDRDYPDYFGDQILWARSPYSSHVAIERFPEGRQEANLSLCEVLQEQSPTSRRAAAITP
jgi:hypothetical protein